MTKVNVEDCAIQPSAHEEKMKTVHIAQGILKHPSPWERAAP